ncbi:hypothetical protein NGI46_08005 [Peribacillus butanolivorans]|uniref:hypothetical protein n=1 Tax=Peribacillus butanolivorans TaxID=421767 RepID=UPI00207D4CEE|nr:hypothetical protein [Peribacillus butanolivorans]MCO0597410.1 hypothetical protein [Peribacillus butanolivorans]
MKLFKARLLEVGMFAVFSATIFGVLKGASVILGMIHPMLGGIIVLLMVAAVIIYVLGTGIYWLFIEPFRKGRDE